MSPYRIWIYYSGRLTNLRILEKAIFRKPRKLVYTKLSEFTVYVYFDKKKAAINSIQHWVDDCCLEESEHYFLDISWREQAAFNEMMIMMRIDLY